MTPENTTDNFTKMMKSKNLNRQELARGALIRIKDHA